MKYLAIGIFMLIGVLVQAQEHRRSVELPPQKALTHEEYLSQNSIKKNVVVTNNQPLETRTIVIMETTKAMTKAEYNSQPKVSKIEILVNGSAKMGTDTKVIILDPIDAISRENYRPGVVEKKEIKVDNSVNNTD